MSGKLLIEQMTDELNKEASVSQDTNELEKQAELEKVAHTMHVIEQAQTLNNVSEEMFKIAQELENEALAGLAVDTYQLGERMGACLSKTASEDGSALEEALEIASDMHKVASVYADIADDVNNEEFSKLAEAVIDIANEMTDEANEIVSQLEEVEKEAGAKEAVKDAFTAKKLRNFATNIQAQLKEEGKDVSKAKAYLTAFKEAKGLKAKMRYLGDFKEPALAYGGSAAALAAAGYGVKKATNKK